MKKIFGFLVVLIPVLVQSQINGRIIDADTRLPLSNARINLPEGAAIHSDATGTFILNEKQVGSTVRVSHIGYLSREVNIEADSRNLIIELQPDPEQLEEVTISAATFSGKLRRQSGSMNLLLGHRDRFRSQEHIAGLINQVPGIYLHHGGYNTNRLTIRGIGSREPYGSNRIKAYLNDIPISGGDGVTVIEDLSLSGIQRIEVLKGPSSAIYGAGLAGTLRLFTHYPSENGFSAKTLHQAGSFGMQKHVINLNYKRGSGAFALDLGRQQSYGFRTNSNYVNNHILFNGEIFLDQLQLGMLFSYIGMKAHIPSSLADSTFSNDPSAAAAGWQAIRGYEEYDKFLAGLSVSNHISQNLSQKTTVFAGNKALYESRPFNILQNHTANGGVRSRIMYEKAGFRSLAGLELYAENIDWSTFQTLQGEQGPLLDNILENRYYTNVFNHYKYSPGEKLVIEAGWNLGWVSYKLAESNNPGYPAETHRFAPDFSPRVGASYSPDAHISLFGSAGKGFSTPSFEETLLPEGIRNDDLKPEKGWNFELGIRGDLLTKRINYDVAAYMIIVNNLLVTKRVSEEIFTGINAGSSFHQGIESLTRFTLLSSSAGVNRLYVINTFQYSVNRFREFFSDSVDYSGNHLPGIPSFKNHLMLTWMGPANLESSVAILMLGKQYLADNNEEVYDGYETVDWHVSWSPDISRRLGISLTAGINNIFDRAYASMILINAPSFGGAPSRYYYPGMPRNFYLQLRLSY